MEKQSILIVDDTPANIDVLGSVLMQDYEVQVATNGPDALEIACSERPPDLILLDIMMPEMDGFEVLGHLKEGGETAEIPVIFVTACTDEVDESRGFEAGCVDYIHKPVSPLLAKTRVRTHMELKRHQSQVKEHLRSTERKAARTDAFFRQLFHNSPQGIALMDAKGEVSEINQGFSQIFGFAPHDVTGLLKQKQMVPEARQEEYLLQIEKIRSGERVTVETERLRKDGTPLSVAMHGYPIVINDRTEGLFVIYEDITRRKCFENKLRHQAYHDELTGIANRAFFLERLACTLNRNQDLKRTAVLFVDLDRFKHVNDSLGHQAGDELIRMVAERFSKCVRNDDMVARLGGDEFAILLHHITSRNELTAIAERLQETAGKPFSIDGQGVHIGASIGIVADVSAYATPHDIVRDADLAMYRSKEQGKGRFTLFDKSLHDHAVSSLKTEMELRKALRKNEFTLRYQPVRDLKTDTTSGFEALIRWNHPVRGVLGPGDFIAIAEETGLIVPIGRWVIGEACRRLSKWLEIDPSITININLSTSELLAPGLLDFIAQELKRSALPPGQLVIEITETVLIKSQEKAAGVLESLKALGVGIAIDDFGTGYSSLSYLHNFPIDTLKIDRSFIQRMDKGGLEIVKTITALAQTLQLKAVAEGVETKEQLELVREAGCSHVQGYYYSPPVTAVEGEKALQVQIHGTQS